MSGVLIQPKDGQLWLPNGELWVPPEPEIGDYKAQHFFPDAMIGGPEPIPLDRIVPRLCLVPDTYAFSAGQEAIDLAAAAGLVLDPWEQLAIILGLGQTTRARWAAFTVALIVARQNGKGAILEALELYWLFLAGEKLIGHSAHEYKTAMEGFRRVLWHIENNDWLRKRVKKVINTNGEEGIELLSGQRLRFMARSKGAGRGFTFHKLVWDEGYALTREQQDAQLPTMSAVDNPQIWITSSPPLTSDTGEVLFQLRRMAKALGTQLTFMDFGIEGSLDQLELIDLDDVELWKRANPSEVHAGTGHGVSVETMARERASMSDAGFARERLCIWPPDLTDGYGIITQEQWQEMLDRNSGSEDWPVPDGTPDYEREVFSLAKEYRDGEPPTKLVGKPVISIAVGRRGQGIVRSAIGLAARRFDGKRHIEVIGRDAGTSWIIPALRALLVRTEVAGIAIDPGSPAGSLLADIESLLIELGLPTILIMKMSSQSVASAFGIIYDAATEAGPKTVVHIGQPELDQAVGGAVTRNVGTDGKTWDIARSTTDVTGLVTVTNSLWALAQPVEEEPEPLVMWL